LPLFFAVVEWLFVLICLLTGGID